MKKIDLIGGESRALKMTGRTRMIGSDILFSVKKIDEKSYGQEDEEKNKTEKLLLLINCSLPYS